MGREVRKRAREHAWESERERQDIHTASGCAARSPAGQGSGLGGGGDGCRQKSRRRGSRDGAVSLLSRRSLVQRNPC